MPPKVVLRAALLFENVLIKRIDGGLLTRLRRADGSPEPRARRLDALRGESYARKLELLDQPTTPTRGGGRAVLCDLLRREHPRVPRGNGRQRRAPLRGRRGGERRDEVLNPTPTVQKTIDDSSTMICLRDGTCPACPRLVGFASRRRSTRTASSSSPRAVRRSRSRSTRRQGSCLGLGGRRRQGRGGVKPPPRAPPGGDPVVAPTG